MWIILADVLLVVLGIVGIWSLIAVRSYFSTYGGEKGKNLATHEDVERIVEDLRRMTQATEEIKTQISSEMWDRQKQWEIKREIFFQVTNRVSRVFEALKDLDNVLQTELHTPSGSAGVVELSIDRNKRWFEAYSALNESGLFAGVTCGKEVVGALGEYVVLTTRVAALINGKDAAVFTNSAPQLLALHERIQKAFRKDLGIADLMPQSTESSAAPTPAAPTPE